MSVSTVSTGLAGSLNEHRECPHEVSPRIRAQLRAMAGRNALCGTIEFGALAGSWVAVAQHGPPWWDADAPQPRGATVAIAGACGGAAPLGLGSVFRSARSRAARRPWQSIGKLGPASDYMIMIVYSCRHLWACVT